MDVLYNLVVVLHLLGMAALVGGYLTVLPSPRPHAVLLWGARLQVLTGLLIVGLGEGAGAWDDEVGDPNYVKIGIKLVVALAVAGLAESAAGRAKRGQDAAGLTHAAGVLAIVNVLVATLVAGFLA